jgi:hypothetical protein
MVKRYPTQRKTRLRVVNDDTISLNTQPRSNAKWTGFVIIMGSLPSLAVETVNRIHKHTAR